jgi:hypothetical protein
MKTTQILDSISPRGYGREHPGRLRCHGCAPATAAPASGCPLTLPGPARPTPETPPEPTGPVLTIAIHQRESHALLQLAGELDMATACALHFQLRTTLAQNSQIVIDVAELSFTDMLGIRILCRPAGPHPRRTDGSDSPAPNHSSSVSSPSPTPRTSYPSTKLSTTRHTSATSSGHGFWRTARYGTDSQ